MDDVVDDEEKVVVNDDDDERERRKKERRERGREERINKLKRGRHKNGRLAPPSFHTFFWFLQSRLKGETKAGEGASKTKASREHEAKLPTTPPSSDSLPFPQCSLTPSSPSGSHD